VRRVGRWLLHCQFTAETVSVPPTVTVVPPETVILNFFLIYLIIYLVKFSMSFLIYIIWSIGYNLIL
jgi:hypothetical protein